eukprot:TRINITY_DN1290_c0_g1_i6.p2 TRINITY_DN1290_c0_g1~~TRINITY_DN1290_c0_g1_i6.p2  ORF type:complete len:118 (+),score=10.53 TRINITY_DN1290_c0_g1_i6:30-356(+)
MVFYDIFFIHMSFAESKNQLDQMKKEDTQNKDKVKTLTDKVAKLEVEKAALSKSIADLNSQIEELKPIQMKKQKKEEKKKEEQQTELPQPFLQLIVTQFSSNDIKRLC